MTFTTAIYLSSVDTNKSPDPPEAGTNIICSEIAIVATITGVQGSP